MPLPPPTSEELAAVGAAPFATPSATLAPPSPEELAEAAAWTRQQRAADLAALEAEQMGRPRRILAEAMPHEPAGLLLARGVRAGGAAIAQLPLFPVGLGEALSRELLTSAGVPVQGSAVTDELRRMAGGDMVRADQEHAANVYRPRTGVPGYAVDAALAVAQSAPQIPLMLATGAQQAAIQVPRLASPGLAGALRDAAALMLTGRGAAGPVVAAGRNAAVVTGAQSGNEALDQNVGAARALAHAVIQGGVERAATLAGGVSGVEALLDTAYKTVRQRFAHLPEEVLKEAVEEAWAANAQSGLAPVALGGPAKTPGELMYDTALGFGAGASMGGGAHVAGIAHQAAQEAAGAIDQRRRSAAPQPGAEPEALPGEIPTAPGGLADHLRALVNQATGVGAEDAQQAPEPGAMIRDIEAVLRQVEQAKPGLGALPETQPMGLDEALAALGRPDDQSIPEAPHAPVQVRPVGAPADPGAAPAGAPAAPAAEPMAPVELQQRPAAGGAPVAPNRAPNVAPTIPAGQAPAPTPAAANAAPAQPVFPAAAPGVPTVTPSPTIPAAADPMPPAAPAPHGQPAVGPSRRPADEAGNLVNPRPAVPAAPTPAVVSDEPAASTTQPVVGDRVRVMGAKPGRDVGTVSRITDRGMVEVTGDDGRIIGGEVVPDRVEKVSGAEEPAPITDVGEKIGGARKDRIAVDDLAGMSSEERQAAVKRSAVWSEPDPRGLIDGGMPVETAWMVMRAYGGIAKAPIIKSKEASDPAKRDAALRAYVAAVGRLRDRLLAARSVADVTAALKAEWPELYQRGMISDYTGYHAARDRYAIVARSNQLANAAADARAMRKDLAAGWPHKAAWQSRYRISESVFAERRGRWTVRARKEGLRREDYARESAGELPQDFATKAEAEAEAERRYAAIKREGGGKEPVRPMNPDARRAGAPRRDGDRDITADELRAAFGFRGVEFGNWSNQADRQQAINQAFDGLHDLAELMGVPPAAMSLDGRLGLAFGARGGGKFAAHYEPGKVVINLTRTRGAGTLAHEWAHAVDNYFGKAGAGGRIDAYGSNDVAMAEDAAGKAGVRREVIAAWRAIRKAMAVGPDGKGTTYRKESAAGGDYWSRPTEMFARAFEVWAAQRIADAGGASPYLVQGVPTGKVDLATASAFARRYPLNEDAQRINAAIEAWARTLKTEVTPQGTTRLYAPERPLGGAEQDDQGAIEFLRSQMRGRDRLALTPEEAAAAIRAVFASGEKVSVVMGPISPAVRTRLMAQGADLKAVVAHRIDMDRLRHALNAHGGSDERTRGQIPLTVDDLANIPFVLSAPDDIQPAGDGFDFMKRDPHGSLVVTEVRGGRGGRMMMVTAYKHQDPAFRAGSGVDRSRLDQPDAQGPKQNAHDEARMPADSGILPQDEAPNKPDDLRRVAPEPELGGDLPAGTGPLHADEVPAGFNTSGSGDPRAQRFVLAPDGGLDWGEISPEISNEINRQAGPIRLEVGWHGGEGDGFGLVHLRLGDKVLGTKLADLHAVLSRFDEIRQVGGRLILSKAGAGSRPDGAFIELVPGDHYSVITAYGLGKKWAKIEPIWSRSSTRTHVPRPGTPGLPVSANEGQSGPIKAAQQMRSDGILPQAKTSGKPGDLGHTNDMPEAVSSASGMSVSTVDGTGGRFAGDQRQPLTRAADEGNLPKEQPPGKKWPGALPTPQALGGGGSVGSTPTTPGRDVLPQDHPPGKPGDPRLYGRETIPGEHTPPSNHPKVPPVHDGIEAVIAWATVERERVIGRMGALMAKARNREARDAYGDVRNAYQSVDPDELAEHMRQFPGHYLRAATAAGGHLDPIQVFVKRESLPPLEPRVMPAPLAGEQAPSHRESLRELNQALRSASRSAPSMDVDQGLSGKAGGFYDPSNQRVVVKYHNDLDLVAHEVGHWAAETWGLLPPGTAEDGRKVRAELARLGVHGSKAQGERLLREGMAEGLRAWMVNPSEAERRAPGFLALMQEAVPPPVLAALRTYGDNVRRFAGSENVAKVGAGVLGTKEGMAEERRNGNALRMAAHGLAGVFGFGKKERTTRPGIQPTGWARDRWKAAHDLKEKAQVVMDQARFQITDREATMMANYLMALELAGIDPAQLSPVAHWNVMRTGMLGQNGRIRDMVTQYGLAMPDLSVSVDQQSGQRMNLAWLLDPITAKALEDEDFTRLIDRAHAYGVAQRTLELEERWTRQTEAEIAAFIEARSEETGDRSIQIQEEIAAYAKEKRDALKMKLARITGAGAGIESSTEVARKAVAELENDPDRDTIREYLRRYRAWSNWNLDYAVASDLLTKEQAARMKRGNQFYIDWHRVFGEDDAPIDIGEAVDGSMRTIHNPLASLLHATWSAVTRGDRNRLMLAFTAPLRLAQAGDGAMAQLGRQISAEEAEKAKEQQGYHDDATGERRRVYRLQRTVQAVDEHGRPTLENGAPVQEVVTEHWVFDAGTEASLEAGRSIAGDHPWMVLMRGLNGLQRSMITLAPGFRLKVPVRDSMEQLMNSEARNSPAGVVKDTAGILRHDITLDGRSLDELFSLSGASMAGYNAQGREAAIAEVAKTVEEMRAQGIRVLSTDGLTRAWRLYQKFGEEAENLARKREFLAVYREKRAQGMTIQEAAALAMASSRDLLDTAKAGNLTGRMNGIVLFLNASVQGMAKNTKMARAAAAAAGRGDHAVAGRLAAVLGVRLAAFTAVSVMARMAWLAAMDDDEERKKALREPAFKRDFAFRFNVPGIGPVAVPKPYEWGFITSGFDRLADFALAKSKGWDADATNAYDGYAGSFAHAVMPLDQDMVAGSFAPIIEVLANHSFFTGGSIVAPHEAGLALDDRKGQENASVLGRGLGAVLRSDARNVDHLIRGYFGGFGSMVTARTWGEFAKRTTGYSGSTSLYASRDVEWVMEEAARRGGSQRAPVQELRKLLKAERTATTEGDRQRAERRALELAATMREIMNHNHHAFRHSDQ